VAGEVRAFLRQTFSVRGKTDPLPYRQARKAWVCRVRLREQDVEAEDYEELRRRQSHDLE